MAGAKILFVGETWQVHVQETKGFDVFTYDYYETAVQYIQKALEAATSPTSRRTWWSSASPTPLRRFPPTTR